MKYTMILAAFVLPCTLLNKTQAAPVLTSPYSFGFPSTAAANPCAEVIIGTNGVLYGTTSAGGVVGQGTVFRVNQDGSGFQLLKTFGTTAGDGTVPESAVILGNDGKLYGTTTFGGSSGYGTVFQMAQDGSGYTILRSFTNGDGAYPEGRLLQGSDGMLYGTTSGGGGTNDFGEVFSMATDGSAFAILEPFGGTNGANPEGGVIEASDGMLYGTTYSGGFNTNGGTVFSLNKDGTGFGTLMTFPLTSGGISLNGYGPIGRLVEGTNGALYGTTSLGGANLLGTIYTLNKDGSGYSVLYNFANTSTNGRTPVCEMILASDGNLYGTASDGGTNGGGSVFSIGQDGSNYVEVAGLGPALGALAPVVEAPNGTLYGTTQLGGTYGGGTVFQLQKSGAGFGVILNFSATGGDGQSSYGRLITASDSMLYGTSRSGGSQGRGTVFGVRFDGQGYRIVTSFSASNGGPYSPLSGVVEGTNGLLYGGTQFGGMATNGALFDVSKGGSFTLLDSFTGAMQECRAPLLEGSDGAWYGLTTLGSPGVMFQFNSDGSGFTNLFSFAYGTSGLGMNPMQALIEGSDHALYGTTPLGSSNNFGSVFKVNKDGSGFTRLHFFTNVPDGEIPMSPLLLGSDGLFYGTTFAGGATNNGGAVFKMQTNGTAYHVILSFIGTNGDARLPCGELIEGTDGMLYGTTLRGGANDQGALFSLNKDGSGYSVLASFGGLVGIYPRAGLAVGPDGAFYGTTDQGGAMGFGAVFRYGAPLEEISGIQVPGGIPSLTCLGIPGTNYTVERTAQIGPAPSWLALYSTNAPANGLFNIIDSSPLAGSAFYRLAR